MTRFQCIGSACEDSCCSGHWDVPVSELDHQRITATLAAQEMGARSLPVFQVRPGSGGVFAVLNRKPGGSCVLLDDDGLCGLHRRCGEPSLPDVCAGYPRLIGRVGERVELSGRVSCPEVARLLLLAEDAAELDLSDVAPFGRGKLDIEMDPDPTDAYLGGFEAVRAAALHLLARREYPLRSRLFFCAYLAEMLRPIYHRGAPALEEGRLAETLGKLLHGAVLRQLHERLGSVSAPGSIAPAIIIGVLEARMQRPSSPAFEGLVGEVTGAYLRGAGLEVPARPTQGLRALGAERLWQGHLARRQVPDAIARRIELYFTNYCANYLAHDWFLQQAHLLHHLQTLLARVALLRFLLFGRPGLAGNADPAAWDRAAVEVFYATARALEHNESQREDLAAALLSNGFITLPHAVSLLQF